jgi:hypothetical protein
VLPQLRRSLGAAVARLRTCSGGAKDEHSTAPEGALRALRRRAPRLHVGAVQRHGSLGVRQRLAPVLQVQLRVRSVGKVDAVLRRVAAALLDRLRVKRRRLLHVERGAAPLRLVAALLRAGARSRRISAQRARRAVRRWRRIGAATSAQTTRLERLGALLRRALLLQRQQRSHVRAVWVDLVALAPEQRAAHRLDGRRRRGGRLWRRRRWRRLGPQHGARSRRRVGHDDCRGLAATGRSGLRRCRCDGSSRLRRSAAAHEAEALSAAKAAQRKRRGCASEVYRQLPVTGSAAARAPAPFSHALRRSPRCRAVLRVCLLRRPAASRCTHQGRAYFRRRKRAALLLKRARTAAAPLRRLLGAMTSVEDVTESACPEAPAALRHALLACADFRRRSAASGAPALRQKLESTGALHRLRAQLRAEVSHALESDEARPRAPSRSPGLRSAC